MQGARAGGAVEAGARIQQRPLVNCQLHVGKKRVREGGDGDRHSLGGCRNGPGQDVEEVEGGSI